MSEWLASRAGETIKGKEASCHKWMPFLMRRSKENWQKKYQKSIQEAKKSFEKEHMASSTKGNNKSFVKYVRCRENHHDLCKGRFCLLNLLEFFEQVNRKELLYMAVQAPKKTLCSSPSRNAHEIRTRKWRMMQFA